MLPAKLRITILQTLFNYCQQQGHHGFIPFAEILPRLPSGRDAVSLQIILLLRKGFIAVPANIPSSYIDPENLEKLEVMLTDKSHRLFNAKDTR